MSKSVESDKTVKRKSASVKKTTSLVMAPAILANGKTENKKSKLSSKQNMKKMDPENHESEEKKVPIDIAALKTQLSSEDLFISSLLTNIPTQGVSTVKDLDGNEISVDIDSMKRVEGASRACNPEELKDKLAAKLSQFKGIFIYSSNHAMTSLCKTILFSREKARFFR